uniref:Uncharacterized protein n=1 Tax=Spongospora subterranea TaxID=70186 RepID=A0A0H5RSD2_9EUKA|eukprot:CRZ11649.1 hypothetical protein [Spongospora subterranea]
MTKIEKPEGLMECIPNELRSEIAKLLKTHTGELTSQVLERQAKTEGAVAALEAKLLAIRIDQRQLAGAPVAIVRGDWPPVGLLGLGMTMITIGIVNMMPANSRSLSPAISTLMSIGGFIQIITGLLEAYTSIASQDKTNRTFFFTVFLCFGSVFLGLGTIGAMAHLPLFSTSGSSSIAAIFGIWGVYSAIMFLPCLRISRAHSLMFVLQALSFFLLAWGEFDTAADITAGLACVFAGLLASYIGFSILFSQVWKEGILPLGSYNDHRLPYQY